jgi:cephalosporin-C deacetylase
MKTKKILHIIFSCFIAFFFSFSLLCQPPVASPPVEKMIKVSIAPDNTDWTYKTGEQVKFKVQITKNSEPVQNVRIKYEVGPEMMPAVIKDSLQLKDGYLIIKGGTMKEPGFLRCTVTAEVDGYRYRGLATVGFSPELIQPTTEVPADFNEFWAKAKNDVASLPLNPKLVLLPERCTEKVNVYHASIEYFKPGTRLYGILCVPKKPGKYPALLRVPGAGVRPYTGVIDMAEYGIITFEIGIHGIPVTMEESFYDLLRYNALEGYWLFNVDDRDRYYYKHVYIGCTRAVDFIFSLPEFDGKNLAVYGQSQGGGLSIITAALDSRVKYLAAYWPALCDLTGFLHNRASGWPPVNGNKDKIETSKYYDAVNFARMLKIPGFYSWGYNDLSCAPTTMYAAYNVINAPKELFLVQETGHWTYPEQVDRGHQWLREKLLGHNSK